MTELSWTCEMTYAHLDAALLGELSLWQRRGFSAHRQECAQCRAAIADAVETVAALRTMPMEEPGSDFTTRVLAARGAQPARARVPWIRIAEFSVVWAVCLMVVLVAAGHVLFPELMTSPADEAVTLLGRVVQASNAAIQIAAKALFSFRSAIWIGLALLLTTFYGAALAGLRFFLRKRTI